MPLGKQQVQGENPNESSEPMAADQDPKKRATAQQILAHEWMRENGTASDKPLDNVILNRMRGFAGMNKLKKEALKVIATGMSPEEIAGLRALFVVRSLHQENRMVMLSNVTVLPHADFLKTCIA